jgi:hypothetical protein
LLLCNNEKSPSICQVTCYSIKITHKDRRQYSQLVVIDESFIYSKSQKATFVKQKDCSIVIQEKYEDAGDFEV